ncbi:flavodoxin family protein [Lysobacter koreensis]|uniref:Flavodoxin family protein n=1 Tax=Lysobacter koreensis TaxID=266122 RepID=A0ABW2YHU4_9GAMM
MTAHTLIAYYSMSGHTRSLAHEIRNATGAELEEIREPQPRHGFGGVVRALFDAVARRTPPILATSHDPADYELLVIGGPVWAGRMAAPVRTYAQRYGTQAPHVAFFCTEGGRGADTAFADLERLCQKPPDATLVVDAAHLPIVEHAVPLSSFTSKLGASVH